MTHTPRTTRPFTSACRRRTVFLTGSFALIWITSFLSANWCLRAAAFISPKPSGMRTSPRRSWRRFFQTTILTQKLPLSDYTFSFLHLLPAARAKSRERHRRRSRLAAAAKLLVDRSCFAAPFGELFLSPAGIALAALAGTVPDRASLCAARQEWQTEAPTPAGAADCPKTALYQTGPFAAYPAWPATCDASRSYACAFSLLSSRMTGRRTLPCGR